MKRIEDNYKSVIGIDEAGRGPWSGPVVACAFLYSPNLPDYVNDSKKISEKKRQLIFNELAGNFKYGIGIADCTEIDEVNIRNATILAMQRAYYSLGENSEIVLVDGNFVPDLGTQKCEYIIKGDSLVKTIGAASIIAKVTRDKIMEELHKKFPNYNWINNKGYGTKCHSEGIKNFGITDHHRKSFKPIKDYINSLCNA